MNQCGKLANVGQGNHAKCGEDYRGRFFQCMECQFKDLQCQVAQDANADASLLDTSSPSPTPVPEGFLTRLDRIEERLEKFSLMMEIQAQTTASIQSLLRQLIESLAEDQDPDEMPARYMDGSPVR